MKYKIDFEKLQKEYGKTYRFLYDNGELIDYTGAVEFFDIMLENNDNFKRFLGEFCNYIQDFINSDRECGALIIAMRKLNYI